MLNELHSAPLRFWLDALGDGLTVVSAQDARIIEVNQQLERLTGVPREQLLQMKVFDLVDAVVTQASWSVDLAHLERQGGTLLTEGFLKLKGGERLRCETITRLVRWNERVLLVNVIRDVQSRQQRQELASRPKLRLASAARLAALGEMAGSVAHEVNNPLGALQLSLENLQARVRHDQEVCTTIQQSLKLVGRIAVTIRSLRRLSRDGSRDPLEEYRLGQLVEDTLDICYRRVSNSGVSLELKLDEELILRCRPVQISQILLNLINNACDSVSTLPRNLRWIRIESQVTAAGIQISVIDGGPGPAVESRARLFEPFFTTKGPDTGTGLGLSLSKTMAEDHGGTLAFDGDSEHCRFILSLPNVEGPYQEKVA